MLERKNKRLAILLAVLTALTVVVTWQFSTDQSAAVDKELFRVDDYTAVNTVELKSEDKKVALTFNGSRWKVNEEYNADRDLINVLFATLQQAEPRRPVSSGMNDSVSALLEHRGVEVLLYEGEQQVQHLYVGGNESKTQAYFRKAEDPQVYVMTIPGYRVYVSGIFELTVNQWREKYAFPFNWRNFKSLTVEFPSDPRESFSVRQNSSGAFGIDGVTQTDTARLNTFLDHVSLLTVNEFKDDVALTDSLRKREPHMIITIEDVGRNQYTLEIFEDRGSDVPGLLNGQDVVIFNRLKLRPILRPRSFFISQ